MVVDALNTIFGISASRLLSCSDISFHSSSFLCSKVFCAPCNSANAGANQAEFHFFFCFKMDFGKSCRSLQFPLSFVIVLSSFPIFVHLFVFFMFFVGMARGHVVCKKRRHHYGIDPLCRLASN
ncbi:hypothetical protein L228DRAFT_96151 [Xylona heveae TC161]|uniref:Uncharacterized protein n=1 Tax=Xylona heveae (strain CBS 132557 / TC161) TaxID=1328760 RepID=A0A165I5L3_XYLHT|nr:hypothetical protein L228DRAFT_96151 [Xylona heveae TC161]KZF24419.1 hypothetical protein L228DRAFT_96151 [Xylona heveae TC161]